MSNVPSDTGFAWNNINRLFDRIAEEVRTAGIPVFVSFKVLRRDDAPLRAVPREDLLELDPSPRSFREAIPLLRAIRQKHIRAIYLTDQALVHGRYALLRLAGIRVILVHSRISVPDPKPAVPDPFPQRTLKALAARTPWISADRVYVVSDFVGQRILHKNRFPRNRVVKILNGIDLELFSPPARPTEGEGVRIFAGSRASRHKGIHVLIEATAILRDLHKRTGFRVGFAGDGPELPAFRRRVEELELGGFFEFLGRLDSTVDRVRRTDIVVVPSIWGDACPSSVSEALAAGKPLVASAVGGIPEMVGGDQNAILVPPGSPEILAEALTRLIENPELRRRLGDNGRRRAEEALDQDRYHRMVIEQILADLHEGGVPRQGV